jgi:Zn-dependent protease with chaperone function
MGHRRRSASKKNLVIAAAMFGTAVAIVLRLTIRRGREYEADYLDALPCDHPSGSHPPSES